MSKHFSSELKMRLKLKFSEANCSIRRVLQLHLLFLVLHYLKVDVMDACHLVKFCTELIDVRIFQKALYVPCFWPHSVRFMEDAKAIRYSSGTLEKIIYNRFC